MSVSLHINLFFHCFTNQTFPSPNCPRFSIISVHKYVQDVQNSVHCCVHSSVQNVQNFVHFVHSFVQCPQLCLECPQLYPVCPQLCPRCLQMCPECPELCTVSTIVTRAVVWWCQHGWPGPGTAAAVPRSIQAQQQRSRSQEAERRGARPLAGLGSTSVVTTQHWAWPLVVRRPGPVTVTVTVMVMEPLSIP